MEDERNIARRDFMLKQLVSNRELEGEVYSSDDDDLDLPYESNEVSDDIEEMVFREQIRGAKQFFRELTEGDDEDDLQDIVDDALESEFNSSEGIVLKPSVKYSDALSYFEMAMERNSKMRDTLLAFKQTLLKKKQEFEDMIFALEERDDQITSIETPEEDVTVTWGFAGYLDLRDGVVFSNKIGLFYNQFASPYFKDENKFYCPPNKDSVEREKNFMLSISSWVPSKHWSPQSIDHLEAAIKKALVEEFKNKADFKAVLQWREYNSFVKSHSLDEIMKAKPPEYKIDWLKVAALLPMEEVRSSSECSKLWDLYLSPKFSKDEWKETEDDKIIELVKKYDEQEWDKVAEELETNRSGFQVFSYYQSQLRNKLHFGEKWTHEEDEYIRNVVAGCTYGDFISWKKVMYYCEKRSYVQVYNRWQNNLTCLKKGKFSEREDRALMTALAHGMDYRDTAKALGGLRTTQQIRDRLMAIVKFGRDNALNIGDWSVKEDSKLLTIIDKHGEKWSTVAKEMETRDRTQCRHRYHRLKKYYSSIPNFDFRYVDRRKRRGYTQTLRSKKRNLLKLLRKGSISQKKKKSFLTEVSNILEETSEMPSIMEAPIAVVPDKLKSFLKYLVRSGSGFWSALDHSKASLPEIQNIEDCCKVLGARFNYDKFDQTLQQDEHFSSVKELVPSFKENKVCDVSAVKSSNSGGASTSSGTNYQNVCLIPPNATTCHGFLQSLMYCSNHEKIRCKSLNESSEESEETLRAKELFQQRLYQWFLWPAILSGKQKKNRLNTYGNVPVIKSYQDLPSSSKNN